MIRRILLLLICGAAWGDTPFYSDKQHLLVYLDARGQPHDVLIKRDWEQRRGHILAGMQQAMGPLPAARKQRLDMRVVEETRFPKYVRKKITFKSEDDRVPAYLLIPTGRSGKLPAMLCLHQTVRIGKAEPAGLGSNSNLRYAVELAERGYVTLAPDYPGFGDYPFDAYAHGYQSATMKGIKNHMRAVDLLQSLREVNGKRIGAIGHSLGGHNALFAAAFDSRLRAVVTSCGFNSFSKYMKGDLTGWSHKGYMPRIASVYGKDPAKMPFDFTEVLGALAPRPVFINAPAGDANFEVSGVKDCVEAALPVYKKILGAGDRLVAVYPDAKHEFPAAVREQAYQFLDRWLR
ncbi:MAG: alpha/beta fold hydrolase [Candidatus Solibacter usitatus]|nr:alpha/beta fold hydrolase [Candidatus Solibacter usitatus]